MIVVNYRVDSPECLFFQQTEAEKNQLSVKKYRREYGKF